MENLLCIKGKIIGKGKPLVCVPVMESSKEEILRETPCINLSEKKLKLFINGVQLTANNIDGLYKIYVANKFIGTGTIKKGLLKRDIIL